MKGENTTKGNPFELTKAQHVIPNRSIQRFENSDGNVSVSLISHKKTFPAKTGNTVFCVNRVWDQRSEEGWMYGIETRYQNLTDLCNSQLLLKLVGEQHELISRMFLLIYMRIEYSKNPIEDYKFDNKKMEYSPSKHDMERLESRHVTSVDGNGTINSRSITGNVMQMKIDEAYSEYFIDIEWEILSSEIGEYIFSDRYVGYRILPISPKLCFIAKRDIAKEPQLKDVNFVNKIGKAYAHYLYFETCK